jgi:hypothetical protein
VWGVLVCVVSLGHFERAGFDGRGAYQQRASGKASHSKFQSVSVLPTSKVNISPLTTTTPHSTTSIPVPVHSPTSRNRVIISASFYSFFVSPFLRLCLLHIVAALHVYLKVSTFALQHTYTYITTKDEKLIHWDLHPALSRLQSI